ncbi:hypothetical protein TNCV_1422811 [Trichonephila clavipes]|nr:hypothetical protein TNCV_1422811 [Trichonephila clavipes]
MSPSTFQSINQPQAFDNKSAIVTFTPIFEFDSPSPATSSITQFSFAHISKGCTRCTGRKTVPCCVVLPVLSSHDAKARDSRCGHFECRIVVFGHEFCQQCGRGSGGGELQIVSRLARSRFSRLVLRIVELLTRVLPHHHPLEIPLIRAFASFEPKDVSSDYLEQEACKGKRAFIQALWALYAKSNLYRLSYKA